MSAMLWADKHGPKTLDDMDYHEELSVRLKRIAREECRQSMPHILIVGPSGAGKSTRVNALLREIYGPGASVVKVETRSVAPNPSTPSSTVDLQVVVSNHHISVTPSDIGNKDRAVVMQLIKEVAAHPPLGGHTFKVVVIEEAGTLTQGAQAALRRTMERYIRTCRLILSCDSSSKIIAALRSRCLAVRVGRPTIAELQEILRKVAIAEGFKVDAATTQKIAEKCERDVRRSLLMLESLHSVAGSGAIPSTTALPREAWDTAIERVAKKILQEQSPRMAMEVRGNVYELLASCLPPDFIIKEILSRILAAPISEDLRLKAIAAAAHFESTLRLGNKDIFHIEAFVLRFMSDFKIAAAGGA